MYMYVCIRISTSIVHMWTCMLIICKLTNTNIT